LKIFSGSSQQEGVMNRFKRINIVAGRELNSYFTSPIAYIVITVFLIFTGFSFFKDFFYFNRAEMRGLFELLPVMFTFVIPAVTMRLFTEERHTGSLEILLTLPLTTMEVVLGKFLSAFVFTLIMIAPTFFYLFTVILVGSPDFGPVAGGYIGTVFLAAASVSIGLLFSSLTRNQIISFILAFAALFFLWLIDKVTIFLPTSLGFIAHLGMDFHFQNISRGIIDSRDIIYFLSVTAVSIMLTARILEKRR
jgi:ABC-2 type transport system permease protein